MKLPKVVLIGIMTFLLFAGSIAAFSQYTLNKEKIEPQISSKVAENGVNQIVRTSIMKLF
jgi:hypothetical protein